VTGAPFCLENSTIPFEGEDVGLFFFAFGELDAYIIFDILRSSFMRVRLLRSYLERFISKDLTLLRRHEFGLTRTGGSRVVKEFVFNH